MRAPCKRVASMADPIESWCPRWAWVACTCATMCAATDTEMLINFDGDAA